jgi:TRAP-type transport system periplasmic protein
MLRSVVGIALGTTLLASSAVAQENFELKFASYIPEPHALSQWFIKWGDQLAKDSNGRITIKRFFGSQMGPANQHYDLARTGQADIAWFFHGGTPGRFPLTEIINMPYMVGSGEIGTKVLNDPELRDKYLEPEHKTTHLLAMVTHQPGGLHTTKKQVRTLDDIKGMRIRFPSPPIRDFLRALGASAVGVPPTEVAEQLSKGVIDGALTDYGGAAFALQLGGVIKHTTELYVYVTSFGMAMNEGVWGRMPADLRKMMTDSLAGARTKGDLGVILDGLDPLGKKSLADQGGRAERLPAEEEAKMRRVGEEISQQHLKELEAKKLPAREVYTLMRSLADRHGKTSMSFWK